jgi:hypothetical protein
LFALANKTTGKLKLKLVALANEQTGKLMRVAAVLPSNAQTRVNTAQRQHKALNFQYDKKLFIHAHCGAPYALRLQRAA